MHQKPIYKATVAAFIHTENLLWLLTMIQIQIQKDQITKKPFQLKWNK